jgi:long-subunit fatty acid transport protein
MKRAIGTCWGVAGVAALLCFATVSSAQQKTQTVSLNNRSYNVSRETVLEGTVVRYTPSATTKPLGARVTLQTSSGVVDVHLGNAKLLTNHFSLAAGDSLRITGENLAYGTTMQFVARVMQKGNQTLAVRSNRGFPLSPGNKPGTHAQVGAL